MSEPEISVIIITRNRPEMLSDCLGSVTAALPENIEVLAGVNGPDERAFEVIARFPGVRAVPLPGICRGEARNALAAGARGRWLCFLDDDTVLPENYFLRLSALISRHSDAAVFGGGQTLSTAALSFEKAVYALLGSPWGGGPFTERFSPVSGTRAAGPEKLILCNLTMDRLFLEAHGLAFEGHLTSAEENLLLNRMAAAGAEMILSGDLNLVHRRRNNPAQFARQVFSSGRGRAQITALSPKGFAPFTLLPPLAFASALAAALFMPYFFAIMAAIYLTASFIFAFSLNAETAVKRRVLALFPVLHAAYACGWFFGALEGMAGKIFSRPRPWRCGCPKSL
ncbi:MAG: hypothetical protein A2021_00455 [Elusimicrobia bacterium GWF2_52_66]|nr:MAG: hypothetical protein A2X33_06090 [Elusimicrobia bacterium GWA2_51_34]OGR85200.1 MAG: hypothetical protein A2021_00455 [Elusimicrobia bacterium GWF2_52_66]HAF94761.1 hypothetical protein [Elusimicrobiota bacterium]HCE97628.1 hypothetical protein [Elusimicrobiota bacterium]